MSKRLQTMPVANAVCRPGRKVVIGNGDGNDWIWSEEFKDKSFNKCVRFNFGHCPGPNGILHGRGLTSHEEYVKAVRAYVGPQKLPFPFVWIEGDWGNVATYNSPDPKPIAYAVRANVNSLFDTSISSLIENAVTYTIFALMADETIWRCPITVSSEADENGSVESIHCATYDEDLGAFARPDDSFDLGFLASACLFVLPAMWAIGLTNCQNIKTTEIKPKPVVTKKQRRPRLPEVSYHTIIVPGRDTGDGTSINRDVMPLHHVRGHFKTFTAERPLLGQHVGTYWWGWQVRGNADKGVVVSDYKLAQSTR